MEINKVQENYEVWLENLSNCENAHYLFPQSYDGLTLNRLLCTNICVDILNVKVVWYRCMTIGRTAPSLRILKIFLNTYRYPKDL